MPDWTRSMKQTYRFCMVNPTSWLDEAIIDTAISCSITRDSGTQLLESATIKCSEFLGEIYVRVYLITEQDGVEEVFPLCTTLIQSPANIFNGRNFENSFTGYSPLIEMRDTLPPLGYTIRKGNNVMKRVCAIFEDNLRCPVTSAESDEELSSHFTANTDEDWLSYATGLLSNANYILRIDPNGTVYFDPHTDFLAMRPVWTFDDSNSSILLPDVTIERDLYGVPNVVEVLYSNESKTYYLTVANNDASSPMAISNRGRKVMKRLVNPSFTGIPTKEIVKSYAKQYLTSASSVEYTVTFKHGYCPVRVGDCVLLDYKAADLHNVKARIISQQIECTTGCVVTSKATFTVDYYKGKFNYPYFEDLEYEYSDQEDPDGSR